MLVTNSKFRRARRVQVGASIGCRSGIRELLDLELPEVNRLTDVVDDGCRESSPQFGPRSRSCVRQSRAMSRGDEEWNREYRGAAAFLRSYESQPPWDIGRPQQAILELADDGLLRGHVLDSGCGTGEHGLLAASLGLTATGLDIVPAAIEAARAKAAARDLVVRFEVGDILDMGWLGETYDTVIDSGLFHVLDPPSVDRYVEQLASLTRPDGLVIILSFSDQVPGDVGPRRVRQSEIVGSFGDGWVIEGLAESLIEVAFGPVDSVHAWLATIRRSPID